MPLDEFDFDRWDEVDHIYVVRDGDGWDISVELEDGEIVDFEYTFSDEEAEDYIWDELWYWAEENGVDMDKEVDYGED